MCSNVLKRLTLSESNDSTLPPTACSVQQKLCPDPALIKLIMPEQQ